MCIIDQTWPYSKDPWQQPYKNPYYPQDVPPSPEDANRLLEELARATEAFKKNQAPINIPAQKDKPTVDPKEEASYLLYLNWIDRWARNEQNYVKEGTVEGLFISNLARLDFATNDLRSFKEFNVKLKISLLK